MTGLSHNTNLSGTSFEIKLIHPADVNNKVVPVIKVRVTKCI